MLATTAAYQAAIRAAVRTDRVTGTLTLTDGTVLPLSAADLMSGTLTIDNQCVTGEELQFGCVYLGQASFGLKTALSRYKLYGAVANLSYGLLLADGTWYEVPLGVYTVAEAQRSTVYVTVKAYDNILALNGSYGGTVLKGTAFEILGQIAEKCGVALGQSAAQLAAYPNSNVIFQLDGNSGCDTWRDCAGAVAQVLGGFVTVDRAGALVLRAFATASGAALGPDARTALELSDFSCHYCGVCCGDLGAYAEDDEGLLMTITDAPLFATGLESHRQALLDALLPVLTAADYTPATLTMPGDPSLEPGDRISLPDTGTELLVTHFVWRFHGRQTLKSVGENPHLSAGTSREQKTLQHLQTEAENRKTIYYTFSNSAAAAVENGSTMPVATVTFVTTEITTAMLLAQLLLTATPTADTMTATVQYVLDDVVVQNYQPQQTLCAGAHTLALFYPLADLGGKAMHRLTLRLAAQNGSLRVEKGALRATVTGQGMAGTPTWDGTITLEETLAPAAFTGGFTALPGTDAVGTCFPPNPGAVTGDVLPDVRFDAAPFTVCTLRAEVVFENGDPV